MSRISQERIKKIRCGETKNTNLLQILDTEGYKLNEKKSTKTTRIYQEYNGKILAVTRNPDGTFIWFDNLSQKSGDVIQWVMDKMELSFLQAVQSFGEDQKTTFTNSTSSLKKTPSFDGQKISTDIAGFTEGSANPFLKNRYIKKEVANSWRFCGSILQDSYPNIIFPHVLLGDDGYPNNKYCGYEIRNKDFKRFEGLKGLWLSQSDWEDDNFLVITESPIDAISYHQLFNSANKTVKGSFSYCAVGGRLSQLQKRLLKALMHLLVDQCDHNIILAMDNDEGGEKITNDIMDIDINLQPFIKKHLPEKSGDDWNDVLMRQQHK